MLMPNLFEYFPGKMFLVPRYCTVVFEGRKVHKKEICELVCFLVLVDCSPTTLNSNWLQRVKWLIQKSSVCQY